MDYIIKGETLESIADAIREKTGKSDKMLPTEFAEEITAISGGEVTLQEKVITENGTFTPDEGYDGFSKVSVNVESGGSGEKLTLFTPSISLQSVTSVLTITDENGGFAQGYNLYANDELVTVVTSKEVLLTDYIEHTETLTIKVQAVGANFNPSDYAVVEWIYVSTDGTPGLAYEISTDGTYATSIGIGTATDTTIEIASLYGNVQVTSIGDRAFISCSNLTSVYIPNSVTSIGDRAFAVCRSLTSVYIPNSVTSIRNNAFAECSSLTSVYIPNGVTSISAYLFNNCSNLKRLDLSTHTNIPIINSMAINGTHKDLQIKVPASLIDSWKNATNWANYASKIVTEFTNEV